MEQSLRSSCIAPTSVRPPLSSLVSADIAIDRGKNPIDIPIAKDQQDKEQAPAMETVSV